MSALLDALGTYLEAMTITPSLVLGDNLMLGKPLGTPDPMATVFEYAGQPPVETMKPGVGVIDVPSIQIVCRQARDDYQIASVQASAIRDYLGLAPEGDYSGVHILRIQAQNSPTSLGVDDNGRPLVAVNFSVWVLRA